MKKSLLILSAVTSLISAKTSSCNFSAFYSSYNEISAPIKTTIDLIGKNQYNSLKDTYILKNGQEKPIKKKNIIFSHGDYYEYNKNENQLCIIKKIDYNYQKFKDDGYLDFLKNESEELGIDYRYMLAIFMEETLFNPYESGGFGRMTDIAIKEVNKHKEFDISEIPRNELSSNQNIAILYSLYYFKIMLNKYKNIDRAIKYYNGNKEIASNGIAVYINYWHRIKKNYNIICKNY